jgi:hypothetical protein
MLSPDFRSDWSRVEALSAENVSGVRSVLGTAIQLPRAVEKAGETYRLPETFLNSLASGKSSGGQKRERTLCP